MRIALFSDIHATCPRLKHDTYSPVTGCAPGVEFLQFDYDVEKAAKAVEDSAFANGYAEKRTLTRWNPYENEDTFCSSNGFI